MSELNSVPAQIYIGSWINWSYGRTFGPTLTLTQNDGALLIAFLALFVAFVGTSFFRIICFILYVYLASPTPQNVLYHQRQALLRNMANGSEAVWNFTQLLWVWRGGSKGHGAYRRLLPIIGLSLIVVVGFAVAGVYSSQISAGMGSEVLLVYNPAERSDLEPTTKEILNLLQPYTAQRYTFYAGYAQSCYSTKRADSCKRYVKPRLVPVIDRNASCPFDSSICKSQNDNLKVDSGLVDSHLDLGINAPFNKRVKVRYILQCAPFVTEGHVKTINSSIDGVTASHRQYLYGPTYYGKNETDVNFTYAQWMDYKLPPKIGATGAEVTRYGIGAVDGANAESQGDWEGWLPIPELRRSDADTSLLFLASKNIEHTQPIDDPWYSAHQQRGNIALYEENRSNSEGESATYQADEAASPMGCIQQYQTCVGQICSPAGNYDTMLGWSPPELTEEQLQMVAFVNDVFKRTDIGNAVYILGSEILDSKFKLMLKFQAPLPNDQWQRDMIRLANIFLASIQALHVEMVDLPPEVAEYFGSKLKNAQQEYVAHNLKIHNDAHSNFSIFGISFTLVVGVLIVLLEIFIEKIYILIRKARGRVTAYVEIEWRLNGILQLQRLAHDELVAGEWSRCDREVPLVDTNERLGIVEFRDRKRPRFGAPKSQRSWDDLKSEPKLPQTITSTTQDIENDANSSVDDVTRHEKRA